MPSHKNNTTRKARRKIRYRPNAPEFVPSWLNTTLRSSTKVVSEGINSLLREINSKRRKSLGETRKTR